MSDRVHTSTQTSSLKALSEEFEQLLARGTGLADRTGAVEAQLIGHRIAPLLDSEKKTAERADGVDFDWPPLPQTLEDCEIVALGGEIDWSPLMAEPDAGADVDQACSVAAPSRSGAWRWSHFGLASAVAITGMGVVVITYLVPPEYPTPTLNGVSRWRQAEVPVAAAEKLHATTPVRTLAPPIVIEAAPQSPAPGDHPSIHLARHDEARMPVLEPAALALRSTPVPAAAPPIPVEPTVVRRPPQPDVPSLAAAVAPLAVSTLAPNVGVPGAPPPLRAPRPTPGPAEAEALPSERERITSMLGRFRAAYSDLNARAAQAVWPTVDVQALERAFDGLKQQELTFQGCTVEVTGSEASALCRGQATYVGRVGRQTPHTANREWDFRLRKADSGWTIASARIR